jgi:exodeoxyribonuclease VII large subunit
VEYFELVETEKEKDKVIYSVTEISNKIKSMLEYLYPQVWVRGEISGFKIYASGHAYFTIKDENSCLQAVIFSGQRAALGIDIDEISDGIKAVIGGRLSAYGVRGCYQIIVSSFKEDDGLGERAKMLEKLKARLLAEGLFDPSHKKPLPEFVKKIGIVTSKDGAVLHDILKVLASAHDNSSVLIYPVRVQGEFAPKEIAEAIEYLNANHADIDVLLVGRGGGSFEDLMAFNSEIVARAIFKSKICIISCTGHQTDHTIADDAADLSEPTPSAAAACAISKKNQLINRLLKAENELIKCVQSIYDRSEEHFERLKNSRALTRPHLIYADKIEYIAQLQKQLGRSMDNILHFKKSRLAHLSDSLNLVSPLSVLKRGYAIVMDEKENVIINAKQVNAQEDIKIKMHDATIAARVKEIEK